MSDTAIAAASAAPQTPGPSAWKNPGGFGFRDLLDIVNPLQHLPIIGSIYRWATGDRPGEAAQIAGDALYGGPIGVAFGLVGAATADAQGHDLGERALAAVFGSSDKAPAATAAAAPSSPAATAAAGTNPTAAAAVPDHPPLPLFGGIAQMPPGAAAVPDHPPMPLFGGIAQMPSAAAAAPQSDAARDFLAHNAALRHEISGGVRSGPATAPVPLVLPAGALPMHRPPAAAAAPDPAAPAPTAATPGAPVDVPQKMMDALDKYMRLEQGRKSGGGADGPPAPVDLSL